VTISTSHGQEIFPEKDIDENPKEEIPAKEEMVSTGDSDLTRLHERRHLWTITDNSKLSSWRTSTNTGTTNIKDNIDE